MEVEGKEWSMMSSSLTTHFSQCGEWRIKGGHTLIPFPIPKTCHYYAIPTFSQKSLNLFCILNNLLQTLQIVDSGRIIGPLSHCIFFLFVA
jgi:hypothetical protein